MIQRGLLRKEWHESLRTYRIVILPLVFLLLGIAQPVAYHFMPSLLEQAGLPEGMIIELPPMSSADVLVTVFDQYNQMGTLVIILLSMGLISREIETGTAGLILSLGASRRSYYAYKWIPLAILTVLSVVLGLLGSAYYTSELFGPVNWGTTVLSGVVYSLQLLFTLSLTFALGAAGAPPVLSAGVAILVSLVLSLLGGILPDAAPWLPHVASTLARRLILSEQIEWVRAVIPLLWSGMVLYVGQRIFTRRDL